MHELWDDPQSPGRFMYCLAGPMGDGARGQLSPEAACVWTVEASSHFEAMTLYYERQGWGEYTTDCDWAYTTYAENGWE